MGNYFFSSDPRDPDAEPSYDSWGPDFRGYWSIGDWITWYNVNEEKYGSTSAGMKFANAWNSQGYGAAPLVELGDRPDAREYFRQKGVLSMLRTSPLAVVNDALGGVGNVVSTAAGATRNLPWIITAGVVALIIFKSDTVKRALSSGGRRAARTVGATGKSLVKGLRS